MEISSQEDHEVPIPINSAYGGGLGHLTHHHHHDPAANSAHSAHGNSTNIINPEIPSNGNNGHGHYEHHHDQEDHHHRRHHQHVGGYNIIINKKQRQQQGTKYKECLKNHAAAMGGNATDGCGEFMPSGEEGTIEALTCSACNCHRNFHRKVVEGETIPLPYYHHYHHPPPRQLMLTHHHRHNNNAHKIRSAVPHQMIVPYMPNSESEDQMEEDGGGVSMAAARPAPPYSHQKKRFRTKFTQEQKEKMMNFAERVGWKIQRQEESVVQQFCQEIGVKRRVLKVWMHNNKHNLAKKKNSTDNVNDLNMSGSNDNNATGNLDSTA
ncbi:PREDICTED: zinc-finger homeodomain protein 4 [Tarenaya hassleriana]|uniref:zinc-finger homeodomain protein 4 n=1 Tax=Tarenaya hassleriana TaxID=28532 RepID=UPI00053C8DA0|nr:PREDICTED: zinc-finger homeodomain protein 4 [Tarenaya hassleriana]XP_010554333.1 PREDICTED: zinc-finger homeodomain protein 4 [Tarenaya hassleriana]XP_010554334.1 PREDICTED: zinc-finger homeodomain protein 4 [Tarenaya hassleriana]XP_010554335.1 PREDICTED: zinc-finger homeodomain protein 4 [Tarenaya hassleriana]XP_010554336.1 PREDICTED: zinc-finger homeodomain protein 4 [Tarenaya hassleriana]